MTADSVHAHLCMVKRGGSVTAYGYAGDAIAHGTLTSVGALAFTLRLPDGSARSVKHRDCGHVIAELSA